MTPFVQLTTNSSGNSTGYFSTAFKQYLTEWINYLTEEKQFNEKIGLDLELTYLVTHNATYNTVVMAQNELEINPFNIIQSLKLNIANHPSLSDFPHFYVSNNNNGNIAVSPDSSVKPMGTSPPWIYVWYLNTSNTYHNAEIPLAFGNDTSGNAEMDLSVTLGTTTGTTSFTGGRGYNVNNTISYYIDNNGTFNPNDVVGSYGQRLLPPSVNKTESAGYIYVVGNVTVDKYREAYVNFGADKTIWLNNYYAHIYVSSINIVKGQYDLGFAYDAYDASSPYDNPTAIKQLGFLNNMTNTYEGNITPGNEVQWGSIYSSTSGNYNNLQGTINAVFGLGLAIIGILTIIEIALGWSPFGSWLSVAETVFAITGLASSIVGLILNGVVTAKSSTVVFVGYAQNGGEPTNSLKGNSILIYAYILNIDISFNNHNYIFPVMWLTGKPS